VIDAFRVMIAVTIAISPTLSVAQVAAIDSVRTSFDQVYAISLV
jgi:hypothetical protein